MPIGKNGGWVPTAFRSKNVGLLHVQPLTTCFSSTL